MKNIVFTLLIVSLSTVLMSAQDKVDSLENLLKTEQLSSDVKIDLYKELATVCLEVNLPKAIFYANEGVLLAKKRGDEPTTGDFYKLLGSAYLYSWRFDSAEICLSQALEQAQQEQDAEKEATLYGVMGNMYNLQQSYPLALEYYMKALSYFENNGPELTAAKIMSNIAALYENTNNHEKSLEYLHRAETILRKSDDRLALAKALCNMASIYGTDLYNEWEKALRYAEEAYAIFDSLKSYRNKNIATQRFVVIYTHYKDYQKALEWAEKGIEIAEQLGSENQAAFSLAQMSAIYFTMGDYREAIRYGYKAMQRDTADLIMQQVIYHSMALSYAYLQDMDSASLCQNIYYSAILSSAQEEFQRAFSEMEVKYESEKKEMKIAVMEEERRLYLWLGVSIGTALLFALLAFIIRQRLAVNRRKLAEQQVKQMEQERQLIAAQSLLEGENAERVRLSKDLHDGLGGMLSVVKLNLHDVKKGVTIEGEDLYRFDNALKMLNDSIVELRRVAHNMMPDSLTRYGLKAALTDFCNSIPVAEFHYFGSGDRMDSKIEILIYRVIHELVNNAMKHSGAGHILIQVVQEEERISFTVQDNGRGFDVAQPTQGNGLNNIRDRVASHNGQISIWSEVGKGTEISVEIKLI